jgi:putative oxygen-independent coproporphyrinogen III oxidase
MSFGIYIHWPFCLSLCPYCDFNSYVADDHMHEEMLSAFLKQLDYFHSKIDKKTVTSIYFGGGTPSLMKPFVVEGVIEKINQLFAVASDVEITIEANPTSFEIEKFRDFQRVGINRLSIGVQSFNDANLLFLGRKHNAKQAIFAIEESSKIFQNTTFDLIYALPKQKLENWQKELEFATTFNTKHLSLYILTIEPNTPFHKMVSMGKMKLKDDDEIAQFIETTHEITKKYSFERYEISNYAKSGFYSRHNMIYWQQYDYIGIGAGAHGRLFYKDGNRYETECFSKPKDWVKNYNYSNNGLLLEKVISQDDQIKEIIISGLRVNKGVDLLDIKQRFNLDLLHFVNKNFLENAIKNNVLHCDNMTLKITQKGEMILQYIITNLLKC